MIGFLRAHEPVVRILGILISMGVPFGLGVVLALQWSSLKPASRIVLLIAIVITFALALDLVTGLVAVQVNVMWK